MYKTDDVELEKRYKTRLACSKKTKQDLEICKELYRKAHPEFKHLKISQGYILEKVVEYYIK